MAKITPDERLIYLALKNVFKGQDALIRTSKKVRRLVQTHQNEPDVRDLIAEYNIDNVCNVAKNLLELRIFESTLEAKIRFPEVFDVSPAQSADRAASEAEAARAEADLIQDIAQGHQEVDARRLSAESETDQQHKRKGTKSWSLVNASLIRISSKPGSRATLWRSDSPIKADTVFVSSLSPLRVPASHLDPGARPFRTNMLLLRSRKTR